MFSLCVGEKVYFVGGTLQWILIQYGTVSNLSKCENMYKLKHIPYQIYKLSVVSAMSPIMVKVSDT